MNKLLTLNKKLVENKRVFLRVDYNVVKDGVITDEYRVRQTLPTIKYLLENNCSIVLASHNGRPSGQDESLSLRPVAKLLPRLLNRDVIFMGDCIGSEVQNEADFLRTGDIMLLENLRFHVGEDTNGVEFAKQLANLADVLVNDAFGFAHRKTASTVALAKLLPHCAGTLMQSEYEHLHMLMQKPAKPYVAIVGGAKVIGKIDVLIALIKKVDTLLIGGAMANTFLHALGYNMRKSLKETSEVKAAKSIILAAKRSGVELHLPTDLKVAKKVANVPGRNVAIKDLQSGDIALDIGSETTQKYANIIAQSNTVFWNGTMGISELSRYALGSRAIASAIIENDGLSIAGGGDTVAFLNSIHKLGEFSFVSTGGGASLEFLAGKKLPGLEAMMKPQLKLSL